MIQKCSYLQVLEVFFQKPTTVRFIREISRNINLAATSVKNNLNELEKEGLIEKKKSGPFEGYIAKRDNEIFIQYKQLYNLYSILELKNKIIKTIGPKAIILFGSYQKGEDIESSDIDLLVISKVKKEINLKEFEIMLKRKINLMFIKEVSELDRPVQENAKNGWVIYGRI